MFLAEASDFTERWYSVGIYSSVSLIHLSSGLLSRLLIASFLQHIFFHRLVSACIGRLDDACLKSHVNPPGEVESGGKDLVGEIFLVGPAGVEFGPGGFEVGADVVEGGH